MTLLIAVIQASEKLNAKEISNDRSIKSMKNSFETEDPENSRSTSERFRFPSSIRDVQLDRCQIHRALTSSWPIKTIERISPMDLNLEIVMCKCRTIIVNANKDTHLPVNSSQKPFTTRSTNLSSLTLYLLAWTKFDNISTSIIQ